MKALCRFFALFMLAYSIASDNLYAEQFEVIIHDAQIKHYLASYGIDLDSELAKLLIPGLQGIHHTFGARHGSQIDSLVKKINETSHHQKHADQDFPESPEALNKIFAEIGIPELVWHESNQANEKAFNEFFEKNQQSIPVINWSDMTDHNTSNVLHLKLVSGIVHAITLYLSNQNIEQYMNSKNQDLHIYIKCCVNTDEQEITFVGAPQMEQSTFTRTYTKQDMKLWFKIPKVSTMDAYLDYDKKYAFTDEDVYCCCCCSVTLGGACVCFIIAALYGIVHIFELC